MADEGIHKEPVSPLRAEPPWEPPDNRGAHSGENPRFPWAMASAGAIWTLAGAQLMMLIPPLLYKAWPPFNYVLHGIAFPVDLGLLFLFLVLSITAALSGPASPGHSTSSTISVSRTITTPRGLLDVPSSPTNSKMTAGYRSMSIYSVVVGLAGAMGTCPLWSPGGRRGSRGQLLRVVAR
jgi:hypothetical protein